MNKMINLKYFILYLASYIFALISEGITCDVVSNKSDSLVSAPLYCHNTNTERVDIYFPVSGDVNLRIVKLSRISNIHKRKKVIIYLPGRASFFEKNVSFLNFLLNQLCDNYSVDIWCIDRRGHGKSDGRLSGLAYQRCHIDSFDTYIVDLHKVFSKLILPNYTQDCTDIYLIGASMGGHIALRYIDKFRDDKNTKFINKTLLIAPMIKFFTHPFPDFIVRPMVNLVKFLGWDKNYVFGYCDVDLARANFLKQKGHRNRDEFYKTLAMLQQNPDLLTAGPTFGYVVAAYDSQDILYRVNGYNMPVVAFLSGQDKVVDSQAALEYCAARGIQTFIYRDAFHNLTKEIEQYAPRFREHLIAMLRN